MDEKRSRTTVKNKLFADRLEYEPPRIVESADFETLALACAMQAPGGAPDCTGLGEYTNS